jgi:hypothetical protein
MPQVEFFRVAGGQLVEQWNLGDLWHSMIQLGVIDPDRFGTAGR